ncbi:MAG: beta-ketoacyl-[acyl-carrier-protein] synthase family protein [Betaproteobacteria bacterium]|nr:beta-ketoacyl-[acyl-carrier-protein] synthase family protein [Betaproteobacteria bacterium]MDE2122527.1 beta-ketoacyl-[acyl-carrier-protein] synthase family protein [Betaproteobacteria bacterium]MDE2326142.1 beta-ketoacyl-[acyl-carrier-protein] synthase family protein [Betaproteobacteria bacterium]
MAEVAITGIGIISPIGMSESVVLENLQASRSGIRTFESPNLARPFPVAAVQAQFNDSFTRIELPFLDRTTQMAILAAQQATENAGIVNYSTFGERAGVFYGTVRGGGATEWEGLRQFHTEGRKTARPYVILGCMANAGAAQITIRQQVFGPTAIHTSACSSSGAAIADACRHICSGEIDIAITGGAEAALTPEFLGAWDGLRVIADVDNDPSRSCKPFSSQRTGLVLGEGSVFFVLESREHAERRGVPILAFIAGWGIASDGYHIGSPHQRGQIAAMRSALRIAGIDAAQLDYINAHATATRGGDIVEVAALKEVLGHAVQSVPVSATKALHAHMLGAASAMELLVCVLALRHSFIPATAHLSDIDPECSGIRHVTETMHDQRVRHAMTLSAGFGGANAALVVRSASVDSL